MPSPGTDNPARTRQDRFRQAWSRFATGIALITTVEPGGAVHGMTANGIASVSLEPPLALLCVGHDRNTYTLVKANRRFGISVLAASQQAVASHYALRPNQRDLKETYNFVPLGEVPVLESALAAMDCRVVHEHSAGDHTIFIAEVETVSVNEGLPLLYFRGSFGDFDKRPA